MSRNQVSFDSALSGLKINDEVVPQKQLILIKQLKQTADATV